MKKNKSFGGRLFALLFVCVFFVTLMNAPAYAASNVWGKWQGVSGIDTTTENDKFVSSLSNTFSVELWHYSGGYWGNNYVRIYDSQVFDDAEQLAEAVNAQMEFEMPLPQEVIDVINSGYNIELALSANGIPLTEIFNLNKGMTFKCENNKVIFKANPKFNFYKENNMTYSRFVYGLNKQIPFVVAPYGYNRYSMWTKNGRSMGAASGYFNPNDPYELGAVGLIHPSQIKNNKGYLQDGLDIYVDRENGSFDWMSSNNIAIGYGTFANAGAVAVHFEYPVCISFYKGANLADSPDVAVTKIEKTSYEANQGAMALVTVQNLHNKPIQTSLNFSIPNIINADETVDLDAKESKTIEFYFQTPDKGPMPMTAVANAERSFTECDYDNNKMTVNAEIAQPPKYNDTSNCGETIRWTERDSHTVSRPCRNHGSHSYTCTHTFVYETTLTTNHGISPKTLKSGYGFEVNADTSISTHLVSSSGGCSNWGNNRSPAKTPNPPTKAEVRLNYTVDNSIGTQGYTVPLERNSSNTSSSSFITAQNPISVKKSRSIFTDIALKGTLDAPFTHSFEIFISGGGVNGVEFCKKIPETFIINGSMYDDDGTTS